MWFLRKRQYRMNVVIQYQIKNPDIAKTRPMLVLRDISVDMSLRSLLASHNLFLSIRRHSGAHFLFWKTWCVTVLSARRESIQERHTPRSAHLTGHIPHAGPLSFQQALNPCTSRAFLRGALSLSSTHTTFLSPSWDIRPSRAFRYSAMSICSCSLHIVSIITTVGI